MINLAIHYRILKLLKETKYAYSETSRTEPMNPLRVHFAQSVYVYDFSIKNKEHSIGISQYIIFPGLKFVPVEV
jgi:hypothetical protein